MLNCCFYIIYRWLFSDSMCCLRIEGFSGKQSLHTLSTGANVFPFLTTSHLMLNSMFLFFKFQKWSLSIVEVLLCSNLKDDLCKLNLVLNSSLSSVSPIYVSWFFEIIFLTISLYTTHYFSEWLAIKWTSLFYIVWYLELILSFCAVAVSFIEIWSLHRRKKIFYIIR